MTLLTVCQEIADELGYQEISSVVGNTDEIVRRMLGAAQRSGKTLATGRIYNGRGEFMGTHDWAALTTEQTFTTNGSASYALTSSGIITNGDFVRFVNNTIWDRTNDRPIYIVDPVTWQKYVSGVLTIGINKIARRRGSNLIIHPTEASGESWAFEYVSNKWCESSGGTAQAALAADTDVFKIDERLHVLDIKWRFLEAMGQPYAVQQSEFYEELMAFAGTEKGYGNIQITHSADSELLQNNLPDIGYGA